MHKVAHGQLLLTSKSNSILVGLCNRLTLNTAIGHTVRRGVSQTVPKVQTYTYFLTNPRAEKEEMLNPTHACLWGLVLGWSLFFVSVESRSVIVEICAHRPSAHQVCSDAVVVSINLPPEIPFPVWGTASVSLPGIPTSVRPLVTEHGLSSRHVTVAFVGLDGVRRLEVSNRQSSIHRINLPNPPASINVTTAEGQNITYSLRQLVIESDHLPFFQAPLYTACAVNPGGDQGQLHFGGYRLTETPITVLFVLFYLVSTIVWLSLFIWVKHQCETRRKKAFFLQSGETTWTTTSI